MRLALALSLVVSPAFAWEFSSSPICTLSHSTEKANVTVTYNRRTDGPYAIEITQGDAAWAPSPMFLMRFDGPLPRVITTGRHRLGADGKSLTVTDRGFGNVLDGIEFNIVAVAKSGVTTLVFPLTGAADAVRRFRVCVASREI